ncbi:MAG: methyltransferase domain-containing protein [Syntrophobacterales bacterium]|nr:MAG: methyltransferase domain-containing protein [Syntrophobacterales bacterium]
MKKDRTERIRARYDRISPYYDIMEMLLEKVVFSRWRRRVFDSLDGDSILEVGVGTGKNVDFYPVGKSLTAIDFSKGMLARARSKAENKKVKVDLVDMDVQDLHFDDQCFDTIVGTFVFCSVPDPIRGLREIKRVCKRDGKIILLEHVRPGGTLLGKVFDFLNPIIVKLMGVNINRNTVENIKRAGLHVLEEKNLFRDVVKLVVANP